MCQDAFIARGIVRPRSNKICIQILNTREEEISLSYFSPTVEKLEDYTMCDYQNSDITVERVKEMLNQLNVSHLNSEESRGIQNICAKFADVFFFLETNCQQQMYINTKFI